MFELLLGLYFGLLPIPCLLWLAAFTERKHLYKDVLREELIYRMRTGKSWKKTILR